MKAHSRVKCLHCCEKAPGLGHDLSVRSVFAFINLGEILEVNTQLSWMMS